MFYNLEDNEQDPSFIRRLISNPYASGNGETPSTYELTYVEFLTHTPENGYRGDEKKNKELKEFYTNGRITLCSDLEWHLPDILNYIEDHSGMLIGDATVRCLEGPSPTAPATFEESFPHTRGLAPDGWVWHRRIRLLA